MQNSLTLHISERLAQVSEHRNKKLDSLVYLVRLFHNAKSVYRTVTLFWAMQKKWDLVSALWPSNTCGAG